MDISKIAHVSGITFIRYSNSESKDRTAKEVFRSDKKNLVDHGVIYNND